MNILLVHNKYRQAGGEDVVFENECSLLERKGHRVIRFIRSNTELRDSSLLGRIAVAPRMLWSSTMRREFAAVLDSERPDLVHIHNTFMAISPSIYSACSERRIPIVQTLHNFRLLCPSANFYRQGRICEECIDQSLLQSVRHGCYRDSRAATALVALMLVSHRALNTWSKAVTKFIALTQFAKDKFVAAGFPSGKFAVKPNFAEPDPGQRGAGGEYALFVGRLAEDKGVRVLLEAWKPLAEQYPLHIVGDGPEYETLRQQARRSRLSGITFRGRLPGGSVIQAMKRARFLVVPSTWYEAFPMCIVEAFACGVPVVCSKLGSLAEIVEDGRTGLHFGAGDAEDLARKVEWAWNHPLEIDAMGRAARARYESEYTAEKNYSLLMKIYEQALASPVAMDSERVALRVPEKAGQASAAREIPQAW